MRHSIETELSQVEKGMESTPKTNSRNNNPNFFHKEARLLIGLSRGAITSPSEVLIATDQNSNMKEKRKRMREI